MKRKIIYSLFLQIHIIFRERIEPFSLRSVWLLSSHHPPSPSVSNSSVYFYLVRPSLLLHSLAHPSLFFILLPFPLSLSLRQYHFNSLNWPGTHCIDKAGLKFMTILLALPPGLQSAEIRAHYVLVTFKFLNYICVSVYVHMALVEVEELDSQFSTLTM